MELKQWKCHRCEIQKLVFLLKSWQSSTSQSVHNTRSRFNIKGQGFYNQHNLANSSPLERFPTEQIGCLESTAVGLREAIFAIGLFRKTVKTWFTSLVSFGRGNLKDPHLAHWGKIINANRCESNRKQKSKVHIRQQWDRKESIWHQTKETKLCDVRKNKTIFTIITKYS